MKEQNMESLENAKKFVQLLKHFNEDEQLAILDIVKAARLLAQKKAAIHRPRS